MLLCLAFIGLLFYESDSFLPGEPSTYKTIYLPAVYMAVIQVVFVYLARQAIKKDDELVRSVDRIR